MIEQSFSYLDLPQMGVLALLEILLSSDNALVLGLLSHTLPPAQRKKALYIGIASSFLLRALALLGISFFLRSFWAQFLGGCYLLYLAIRYGMKKRKPVSSIAPSSFWSVVLLIELLDLVFAIDSMVAGIAFINSDPAKLWIVYFGGMLGIIGLRYAADLFAKLLTHFPKLEFSAYLLVGWIGLKLIATSFHQHIPTPLFWAVILFFLLIGFRHKK